MPEAAPVGDELTGLNGLSRLRGFALEFLGASPVGIPFFCITVIAGAILISPYILLALFGLLGGALLHGWRIFTTQRPRTPVPAPAHQAHLLFSGAGAMFLAGLGIPLVATHAMPFLAAMLSSVCTAFLLATWKQPAKPAAAPPVGPVPPQMTAPPQALPVAAPISLGEALNRVLGEDGACMATDDAPSRDPRAPEPSFRR